MTMTRRARKAKRRSASNRRMKKARRTQNRTGGRMSTRGYKKAKRKGRRAPKRSTFMKLRRTARNPRHARNPMHEADWRHDYRNGASVEVWNDGEVVITDPMGRDMDDYFLKPYEVPRFKKEVASAPGQWHHWMKDMVTGEYEFQGRGKRNPGRRGRRQMSRRADNSDRAELHQRGRELGMKFDRRGRRRNPSRYSPRDENSIETVRIKRGHNPSSAITKYLRDGSTIKVDDHGWVTIIYQGQDWDSYRIGQGRLAHFVKDIKRSANRDRFDYKGDDLSEEGSYDVHRNPRGHRGSKKKNRYYHRAAKHGRGRGGHRRGRNPKIAKRDAAALKRVLSKHGYPCGRRARR